MEAILTYLDTMFASLPQTPRLMEAKAELRAMMEDKYTELVSTGASHNEAVGQVITEFGNLDELAPILGISSELHLGAPTQTAAAPSPGTPDSAPTAIPVPAAPPVDLERAQQWAAVLRATRWQIAAGVALLLLSPISLVLNPFGPDDQIRAHQHPFGAALSVGLTIVQVACCVLVLVARSQRLRPYRDLRDGHFTLTPEVQAWAATLEQQERPGRNRAFLVAMALWILSPISTVVGGILDESAPMAAPFGPLEFWAGPHSRMLELGVVLTLILVAFGLLVWLASSWSDRVTRVFTPGGAAKARAEAGSWDGGNADESGGRFIGVIASVWWPLTVVTYLVWSFLWNAWDRSWLIWPVSALLFGALSAVMTHRSGRGQH
ncbi:hypothetical protein I6B53_10910 [Schaalia sp. 19OD2882]|uniref:permease prefix domain 1-containing protein n=1 Tax=Schaalia sp. 19OD2882 TaxID=2794089 RepID=UPI001C1EDAFE|nr:permease prefix domain 1-containing protein [Schaalia sp. 19OD2882]QWW19562.1 hypothetical protein I6B53_10910 [Schaalia sp. 19OD2882]